MSQETVTTPIDKSALPDARGHFGQFGGMYVPETLMTALYELDHAYREASNDPVFRVELESFLSQYAGRPTELTLAERLTEHCGGAKIYLKREDGLHTGAHKINNCIGQALLARRMGKKRIIAETGAGQHGVATAAVCARFGLECVIYMGAEDMRRQSLNVFRMRLMGPRFARWSPGKKRSRTRSTRPCATGSPMSRARTTSSARPWARTRTR